MKFLNNLKVLWKMVLLVALLSTVAAASMGFAIYRMNQIDETYSDLVNNDDRATIFMAQSGRNVEQYVSTLYQLLTETTDEGNKVLQARNVEAKELSVKRALEAQKAMPGRSSEFDGMNKHIAEVYAVCDPLVGAAAAASSIAENIRIAALVKTKCAPIAQTVLDEQIKFVRALIISTSASAKAASEHTVSTIRVVAVSVAIGLLVSIAVGIWIAVKGLSQPIAKLMGCHGAFCSERSQGRCSGRRTS